ncbi:MAG: response regulator [Burkholderiaceae bacterium]|nr:response regulator [Burkholderiaceae bacterium]
MEPLAPIDPAGQRDAAFRASLAHDLRTPLNAMVGWLHLLVSGTVSEELRLRALAGLQRAVEQQRRVVARLDSSAEDDEETRPNRGGVKSAGDNLARDEDTVRKGRGHPAEPAGATLCEALAADGEPLPDAGALHGVHVLAIDDDPDVLQMLQSLLEHSGATVESTTSPDKALRRYASWAGAEGERLVLSDLAMQERDGISLMQAMRALEREKNLRRVPAIALSAHFRPDTRREAFQGGFDLFLAKPIEPSVLLNHLRAMLDR